MFGASAPLSRLQGGQGRTYRAGDIILKPASGTEEARWVAYVYSTVVQRGFTVPRPIATREGDWVYKGWTAWQYLAGETVQGERYGERLEASVAFHKALKTYQRPAFLDSRTDPWSQADRIVWENAPWKPHPRVAQVYTRLCNLTKPLTFEAQVIHGDISGNMLFAPGEPPAVIDFSPYWRPARFAEAIFVLDAVMWERAPWDIAKLAGSGEAFFQLLIRAAMRRLAEVDRHYQVLNLPESCLSQVDRYAKVASELEKLPFN